MRFHAMLGTLAALMGFIPVLVRSTASTFYIPETETQFSLNLANDSSDVYINFASPAYSWVGVGLGAQMEKSLMFIMYPNRNGDNVTLSPRFGSKASEPTFSADIKIDILPGTMINDSMLILHARCRSCRVWPSGFLDDRSVAQPMIYAFGHGDSLYSDSPSANLKRHIRYGHFTMDMKAATGPGGVPERENALRGITVLGDMTRDHDRTNLAHAVLGCLAVFVLWPLNLIVAAFFKNIKIYIGMSIGIVVMLVISYALGIAASGEYNRSKTFTSPHQIIALLTILPILLISILPTPSISRLHTLIPRLHTPITSITFLLLLLIGGLGLHLSSQTRPIILAYVAVSLIVTVFIALITKCIRKRGSAHARAYNRQPGGLNGGPTDPNNSSPFALGPWSKLSESRSTSQASLRNAAAPPAYSHAPPHPAAYDSALRDEESREFGSDGQQQRRSPTRGYYGGGTMPGPKYLLNMHPGVPVNVGRL